MATIDLSSDAALDALIESILADMSPAGRALALASMPAQPLPVFPVAAAPVAEIAPRKPFFNVSWRKVGGLTFVRVGRLSLSFCLTRKGI